MNNNKGFTLVELLVAVVILGIIYGMTFPIIRRLQENNSYQKYMSYGDILINAAKLYVDAYEEDLFIYEDDMNQISDAQKQSYLHAGQYLGDGTQCIFITYQDFLDHGLIQDINIDNISCHSDYTFVRVIRDKNNKMTYKYYLGCGIRKRNDKVEDALTANKITFTLPDPDNILELNGHYAERCSD